MHEPANNKPKPEPIKANDVADVICVLCVIVGLVLLAFQFLKLL